MQKHKVLIVGGGFAGVKTARELAVDDQVTVTLLSDQPDFRYYPVTYHTATGGMRAQSSIALDSIFENLPVILESGTADHIDRDKRLVVTEDGREFHYDILVLALGSVNNYFGISGMQEYSFHLKTMEGMQELQRHLHAQLADERRPDLNYVIVGAGPTGIELAGSLPGYIHTIMDNHGVKHRAVHVDIIEAAPRLLPRSKPIIARAVAKRLRELGVTIYTASAVQGRTADDLTINGKPLRSHTVIWTAGIANHPFLKKNGFTLNERGKAVVNEQLAAEQDIYIVGDNAATQFSGMADTAMRDGQFVARVIKDRIRARKPGVYKPKRPASIIPVGPQWAAVEWRSLAFYGKRGWLLREWADWLSFHKLEPWWKANRQWATEFGKEEHCPTCATAQES